MKNQRSFSLGLSALFLIACMQSAALSQATSQESTEVKLANISGQGLSVRWDVAAPHSALTVTISGPDGRVFRREYKAGKSPEFTLTEKDGERLPDGQYTYELRLSPVLSAGLKKQLKAARGRDDEAENVRAERKRGIAPAQALVQSGSFAILNGAVIVAGAQEETGARPAGKVTAQPRSQSVTSAALTNLRQHHVFSVAMRSAMAMPDQVIPDDLIVQGSACVGLDCVNGEVFGFDTIRMKENNARLQFDDTSTTAGFPTNNWQIRANSSASGGASFLAFVDQGTTGNSETGTIVFEVDAGAPANSLKVSSTGKVGLRTATPVLDVHINTSDTPAHRLEQNSSGGFTAQTWDVAGNEANFFVRDVTGGSRLPFRIRPGAPTSSIDISASGGVGIGFAGAAHKLDVAGNMTIGPGFNSLATVPLNGLIVEGNVGIATAAPTDTLSVNGTASKPGGGSWSVFSDERLKTIKGRFNSGLKAVMQLQPLRYQYKPNNVLSLNSEGEHVGFGAQAVQKIIPEAVTRNENGYLQVNNDPIIWTMLNAIKEQQAQIQQLQEEVRQLRAASGKHRK